MDMKRQALAMAVMGLVCAGAAPALAAGDLTAQEPVVVNVELGAAGGEHRFSPADLAFETGRLYKLVLANPSPHKHYFTSPGLAARVFTRKVQVVQAGKTLAEVKGNISEIEVYPGATAEWWFVPVAAGSFADLHCHVRDADGKTHAEKGMTGTITIR